MNSWWFRMKPRSIVKTIKWFPSFAKLEGEDWDKVDDTKISKFTRSHVKVTRRKYIYNAHGEDIKISYDDFMSGQYDEVDVESAARNDKITFEFFGFGYVDKSNIVRVTDMGRIIVNEKLNDEYILRQLLKIQFPSPVTSTRHSTFLFPLEILIKTYENFDYLNQYEIALLFGCTNVNELHMTIESIKQFRSEYNKLSSRINRELVSQLYKKILIETYPNIDNKPETYLDYADALTRAVTYTGLFLTHGRGYYKKLCIPDHSKDKLLQLQSKYHFVPNDSQDIDTYMKTYGDPTAFKLPWDNVNDRTLIVRNRLNKYIQLAKTSGIDKDILASDAQQIDMLIDSGNLDNLIRADEILSEKLLTLNEEIFILYESKKPETQREIIEKFLDIIEGNEDMAALWLEVNTWKSLVAITGNHRVIRNFKLEEDLTPRSFAPGIGNTPDMVVYVNGQILVSEVSLLSGVKQWINEGSSVVEHVLHFINDNKDKKDIYGIFISGSINNRTMWQFFILNRESWVGNRVPVIPLTLRQHIDIITYLYEKRKDIHYYTNIIIEISQNALKCDNYTQWKDNISQIIKNKLHT